MPKTVPKKPRRPAAPGRFQELAVAQLETSGELRRAQFRALHELRLRADAENSRLLADFRRKNAGRILDHLALRGDRSLRNALDRGIPFDRRQPPLKDPRFWEAKHWFDFLGKLLAKEFQSPLGVSTLPVITDAPEVVRVGHTHTLLGARLDPVPGLLQLVLEDGTAHDLVVVAWADTFVTFTVPETIVGVPFDTEGKLRLQRVDGEVRTRTVGIEPLAEVRFFRDSFSASDSALNPFDRDHTFVSAAAPASFRKVDIASDLPHRDCVEFESTNDLVEGPFGIGTDLPVTVRPLTDARLSGGRLEIDANLKDDRVWDFTVTAEFFLIVPRGIPSPGWSA